MLFSRLVGPDSLPSGCLTPCLPQGSPKVPPGMCPACAASGMPGTLACAWLVFGFVREMGEPGISPRRSPSGRIDGVAFGPEALEFVDQGTSADAEGLGGLRAVEVVFLEGLDDGLPFDLA